MRFELKDFHRNVSSDDLLADLKRVSNELCRESVTYDEYDEKGSYRSNTLMKRVGGWNRALEQAGLRKNRSMNISKEDLFYNLEEVWVKLGRQPRREDIQPGISKYSKGTYERRFGTWRKALEVFVEYVNNEQKTSSGDENIGQKGELATKHKTCRTVNWRLRFIVMRRDNFRCKQCGRSPATDKDVVLHVDHIKAWAKGGETTVENLQTLCSVCNIGKSDLD
jgi:hypothetical protein